MIKSSIRQLMAPIIILCIFSLHAKKANGQAIFVNPFNVSYFQPTFGINMGTIFNHEDFLLDFGLGLEELGYDFSATFNGSFRPYYKTVRFEEGDGIIFQAQERVLQFSIDLEKRFYFTQFLNDTKLGVYGGLKLGYFYGKYKGFKEERNNLYTITPGAGLSWQFSKISRLNLGYLNLHQNPYSTPHTINIKFSMFINNN